MKHITIQLSSPPIGTRSVKDIIRIKTPEKMFSLSDNVTVETEQESLDTGETCLDKEATQVVDVISKGLPELDRRDTYVYTNGNAEKKDPEQLTCGGIAENFNESRGTVVEDGEKSGSNFQPHSGSQTQCDGCGRSRGGDDIESELYIIRKDLASVRSQLEEFKSRLEEELVERFKLEGELKSVTEAHEDEIETLNEKIERLEYNESERAKQVEELENAILVCKEEHGKGLQEVEDLRKLVSKYHSEVCKLKAEANVANDQAVEAINQMEILTKKTQRSEHEKEKIKEQLKCEVGGYWKEVLELRNALENWEKVDSERKNRIRTIESEIASCKDLMNELRGELTDGGNKTKGGDSVVDQNSSDHIFMLCKELNEIFRENRNSQAEFSELTFVLTATQKELEEARNRNQLQNLALQDFKQKFNDLHDNMLALAEENRQLRNSLEKKCKDFRNIRRKFLVSETEVSWLKEALNIVDNTKRNSVCSDVMESTS